MESGIVRERTFSAEILSCEVLLWLLYNCVVILFHHMYPFLIHRRPKNKPGQRTVTTFESSTLSALLLLLVTTFNFIAH